MDNNDLTNKIVNRCSICLNIPNIKIYPQNLDLDIDYICHKKKSSIPYNQFNNLFPKILLSKTKCLVCGKYSSSIQSYFCIDCKRFFCEDCVKHHNKINYEHNINKIPQSDTKCNIHNKNYHSYCKNCFENFCEDCMIFHETHDIINFNSLIIDNLSFINEQIKTYETIIDYINKATKNLISEIKKLNDKFTRQNKFIINLLKTHKEIYINQKEKNEFNYSIIQNLQNNINFQLSPNPLQKIIKKMAKIENDFKEIYNKNFLKPEKTLISQNKTIKKIESKRTNNDSIKCVLVLNDGRIVTGSKDKTIKIFDAKPELNKYKEINASKHVWHIAQLKNDNIICGEDDGIMELFDIDNLQLIYKYEKVSDSLIPIWNIVVFSTNQNIISCCKEGIKIWESSNKYNLIKKLEISIIPNNNVMKNQGTKVMESIYELPNNQIVSTSDDSILRFWDLNNYQNISSIDNIGCCSRTGFALISQNTLAIANRYEKKVTFVNIETYEINFRIYFNNDTVCLLYLREENLLLVGEQNVNEISVVDFNKNEHKIHFQNQKIAFNFLFLNDNQVKGLNAIVRMKNGDFITVTYDNLTEIWRLDNV